MERRYPEAGRHQKRLLVATLCTEAHRNLLAGVPPIRVYRINITRHPYLELRKPCTGKQSTVFS